MGAKTYRPVDAKHQPGHSALVAADHAVQYGSQHYLVEREAEQSQPGHNQRHQNAVAGWNNQERQSGRQGQTRHQYLLAPQLVGKLAENRR